MIGTYVPAFSNVQQFFNNQEISMLEATGGLEYPGQRGNTPDILLEQALSDKKLQFCNK